MKRRKKRAHDRMAKQADSRRRQISRREERRQRKHRKPGEAAHG